jgi:predicted dinucleotide-binding enzyme
MKIGIIGTGNVGKTIAEGGLRSGHEVKLGARSPDKPELQEWLEGEGKGAEIGSIEEAAAFGELIVNATPGDSSVEALRAAGAVNLSGKTLIDIGNAGSGGREGFVLSYVNDDSLAEQIQREFPEARVVKALNTMHRKLMTTPDELKGEHTAFICGNEDEAKSEVRGLLEGWGWKPEDILDLGDLTGARGMEMFIPLWLRIYGRLDYGLFNVRVTR